MRTLALVVLAYLSSSCVFHVHVHETPLEPTVASASPASHGSSQAPPSRSSTVSGVVVDAAGQPVQARVAIVHEHGSVSNTTDDSGRFSLDVSASSGLVLHASTDDGRVAFQAVPAGAEGVRLVLEPGGVVTIQLSGPSDVRCAVFQGETRLEDFTVRANKSARVVVPTGPILVRLYDSRSVHVEQSFTVEVGETENVKLAIGA